jgi:hypothetical protein
VLFLLKPIKLTATDDCNRNEFKCPYSEMFHKEVSFVDLALFYKKSDVSQYRVWPTAKGLFVWYKVIRMCPKLW